MTDYAEFLKGKVVMAQSNGFEPVLLSEQLFDFQRDITQWAIRRGRAAIFADCGLGKTPMQLIWADQVQRHCGPESRVLILCPLAVAQQTVLEGEKFGVTVRYCRHQDDVQPGITITNYEMLPQFDASQFAGVVIDESSILKHYDGKFRTLIIDSFRKTPFRLACTATPAPNDYMELGNHAEFLGVMSRTEMLSMFFVHDGGETQKWRLKGHAQTEFWKWVCSWAVMLRKPSDLGYEDADFILPPLNIEQVTVPSKPYAGYLLAVEASTMPERLTARRESISDRVKACAELVNRNDEPWLIWCGLNDEADELELAITGAVQVKGSERPEHKTTKLLKFTNGEIPRLITKPSIAGMGMNWQHCWNIAFVGLSDSWEEYYQAVRRCWRFGQKRPVNVWLIASEAEGSVVANIKRKEADAARMAEEMVFHMHDLNTANIKGTERTADNYRIDTVTGEGWTMHLGDCVDWSRTLEAESIDYSVFSPPFASLYTYSASERDMGNCRDDDEFMTHFGFLVAELYRVIKPGRNVSFHCMDLPTSKAMHGVIGLRDFPGELIRMFETAGFIYHSRVVIWKDPVTAMQRTKALGLLHKQILKDSAMSRQGIPDYLITMRKPGVNPNPIAHTKDDFPVSYWQQLASPVWATCEGLGPDGFFQFETPNQDNSDKCGIDPGDTLQYRSAREHNDERHICPLQLPVIKRAIQLWSRSGDLVLSPFAGIGSEGFVALRLKRRFVGFELKESYFKQACANLESARKDEGDLFGRVAAKAKDASVEACA